MDIKTVFEALSIETLGNVHDELESAVGASPEEGGSSDLKSALSTAAEVLAKKKEDSGDGDDEE